MPIKGEQQGYTYKVLIDGKWQEVTIQESPLELAEIFEQDEEWTRVKHGHWVFSQDDAEGTCSCCQYPIYGKPYNGQYLITPYNYCPNCGAKMDEVEE